MGRIIPFLLLAVAVAITACQTSYFITELEPEKPLGFKILAENAEVTTRLGTAQVATIELHGVRSRGERTRLLVETVPRPTAILVLFAGGKGAMKIDTQGNINAGNGNFLIRTRIRFLQLGFTTVVIDAPTDHYDDLRFGFRGSIEHAMDIGAVIAHLRARYQKPVWLLGTSRGTNSVGNAASRLKAHQPDGIVLTASMLVPNANGNNLFDFRLGEIATPVLIAHHEEDDCFVTPPDKVDSLRRQLTAADPVAVRFYGGGNDIGDPCGAMAYHGFNGIEMQVIDETASWIEEPTPG